MRREPGSARRERAETLAVQALAFLAEDPQRLTRFLDLTGVSPHAVRRLSAEPGFLRAVLDYVAADEPLLLTLAEQAGIDPSEVVRAGVTLGSRAWERDTA